MDDECDTETNFGSDSGIRDVVCDPSPRTLPGVCSNGRIRVVGARGSVQESALELNIWELLAGS